MATQKSRRPGVRRRIEEAHGGMFFKHLRRGAMNAIRVYDKALRPYKITVAQFELLVEICYRDRDIYVSDLAQDMGVTRSAINQMINRLVEAGYIDERRDPMDRRVRIVRSRAKGRLAVDQIYDAWYAAQRDAIRTWQTEFHRAEHELSDDWIRFMVEGRTQIADKRYKKLVERDGHAE